MRYIEEEMITGYLVSALVIRRLIDHLRVLSADESVIS